MNKKIMKEMGFDKEVKAVEMGICPFCLTKVKKSDFRDPLSLKEFGISGLCQSCQDRLFG